jgi:hypothetical protein
MMDKKSGENFIVKKRGKNPAFKKMSRIRKGSINFFIEEEKKCDGIYGLKTGMRLLISDGPRGRPFGRLGP